MIAILMKYHERVAAVFKHPRLPNIHWLIGLCVVVAFSPVLLNDWIGYDDPANVTENPNFFPVTWRGIARFWLEPYYSLYIPVSYSLFALEAVLSRLLAADGPIDPIRPIVFHATSIALHVASTLLVFRLLIQAGSSRVAAGMGSLLFGLHPLQVESVAWISEQRGLLAVLLSLIAIDLLLQSWNTQICPRNRLRISWVALATFAAGLLAKPSVVCVPLLAVILGSIHRQAAWRGIIRSLLPWFLAAAVAVVVNRFAQPTDLNRYSIPLLLRPVVAADALGFYAGKIVWPVDLCIMYGRTPDLVLKDPLLPIRVVLVAGFLMAVAGLPALRRGWRPVAIFLAALLPVLGLVSFVFQNQSGVADRYAYLAMLGPALGLAMAIDAIPSDWRVREITLATAGTLLLGCGLLSLGQARFWQTTATVAEHACEVAPHAAPSWVMLSGHHLLAGDPQRAAHCALRALALAPGHRVALLNLAGAAARLQDHQTTEKALRRLLAGGLTVNEVAELFFRRGCQHLAEGRDGEAVHDLTRVLDIQSDHEGAAETLATARERVADRDDGDD